jgi:AcrR family transcriptional regulator
MARRAHYTTQSILDAAGQLVAQDGPAKATIGAIAQSLSAPTGSIYHRFRSKELILAELWLQTVEAFQVGFQAALGQAEPYEAGLQAALHTPRWVRANPLPARLLLAHHREDFVPGEWPAEVLLRADRTARQAQTALDAYTRRALGSSSASAKRRVRYAVVELPIAGVIAHVRTRQCPPAVVDELIASAYHGVMHSRLSSASQSLGS